MRKYKKTIKRCVWAVLAAYLLYAVLTGVVPAMLRKSISEEFASGVRAADYYGEQVSVDRAALVETPEQGLASRLHILDEAQERIDISYYAIHMGQTTDLFLGAVLDAAERGVQVRLVVDAQFGGLTHSNGAYAAALGAHPNITLKIYNPVDLRKPWTWNGRLHDKYILIDDRLLLLGGRNIGDKYFAPAGYEKQLSLDRDVLVYNTVWDTENTESVLFQVRQYMDAVWDSPDCREIYREDTDKGAQKRQDLLANYSRYQADHPAVFAHAGDDYQAWTFPTNRISFVHNDHHIGIKEPKAGYVLGELLTTAQKSVTLQSPYVILDPMLRQQLEVLGRKQIQARILTNSVASSPNPIACAAYYGDRGSILKSGVSVWEYQGADSIHAKSYVVDDRLTAIGSYNLDPRSAYLDTELLLVIDSPEFTAHFQQVQDTYFRQSLLVSGDGSYDHASGPAARPVPVLKWGMVYGLYLPVKLFKYLA